MTDEPKTIYISIGNSDNKLTQVEWRALITLVRSELRKPGVRIIGEWFSLPDEPWQNAVFAFQAGPRQTEWIKDTIARAAPMFKQDSIAWATAETEFLNAEVFGL